jgi:choline dehydrogenase-like flavoprotein
MFIDARQVTTGAVVEADIAIVGAGAAGISLALELSGTGLSICLLESGGIDFAWPTQFLYTGTNVGLPYYALDVCQLRYLGGSTNAWGGWCRPLDPIDFEPRPWVEHSGWPFAMTELAPFYPRAHKLCQVASDNYDLERCVAELGHPRAKPLPFDQAWLESSIYRFSPPTRFGQVYREALRRADDLRCYLNANVLVIKTDAAARNVTRLIVGTLSGVRFEIAARHYVLAAGGIENARLLLLSNDVVVDGLGNQHDRVGRYFMEHPHTKRTLIVPKRRIASWLYGEKFHARAIIGRLSLPPDLQRREGLLSYSANIHAVYFGQESLGWLALRKLVLSLSRSRRSDPLIRLPPYGRKGLSLRQVYDMVRQFDQMTIAALLRLFQTDRFITGFVLESKSEQAPNPESRVTLDDARDAFGLRRVKLDWRMLPIDRRTVVRSEEIVDAELHRLGIGGTAPLTPEEIDGWPSNLEGGWHQLGTTRMHTDAKHGVVDANGCVHGMSNLFVVGGSVFPSGGVAPPTLTIVALALRLASHLKQISSASDRSHPGYKGDARFDHNAVPVRHESAPPVDGRLEGRAREPKITQKSRISSREITENDLHSVATLLGKGLDYDTRYFFEILTLLMKHPTPTGFPKYGYLLENDGVLVGAILLIFTKVQSRDSSTIRCHVTSWYVKPAYSVYAALFYLNAFSHKSVIYMNISALRDARPFLPIQGFSKYSRGQFFAVPALHLMSEAIDCKIISGTSVPDVPFKAYERDLLLDHAEYGCICFWCVTSEQAYPFVFRTHLTKNILPGVQLVYCREIGDFVKFARPIGSFFARHGKFIVRIDSNGPIPGLKGKYIDGATPRWYKGPVQPHLGDLAYTQFAMYGGRRSNF